MDIEKKVIECLAMAYETEPEEITLDTDIREDLSAQSIKMIGFVGAIEEEFEVVIDFNEVVGLVTVRDFVNKIKELRNE